MALQKCVRYDGLPPLTMKSLRLASKASEKAHIADLERSPFEDDVDIDHREVYFLIMHFLSAGPCHRTYGQFWNELLEHRLLPRRYHAWYSRSGAQNVDEDDDGVSFPLSYNKLVERYPHIEKDHLVKLLKRLILKTSVPSHVGGSSFNASAIPTLLGTGSFSLLAHDGNKHNNDAKSTPVYMRWPHMLADQVRGLSLREIGGGFSRHHRSPSIRAACYAIAKPSTMVQKMQNIKKLRGHRNAVYCAIFDRSGRYVITGSDDRLVKIWSMETAYCLASCRGHEGDITDLAVNFNNTLVASASNDCIIRVWRLPDGLPISVLRGHTGAVTAIAFSPRPSSVYQLLSSSDDGTCRIWDARYSQFSPRIYIPKPPDSVAVKINGPSSSAAQHSHQIFCCAFNASGTVFVTGSSDTLARVWNACKSYTEDSDQPNHEMDVLAGHENDVNYVQFSGCAVASRFSMSDTSKEDNIPKFKNTWFNHDNIVTCSRDGSAIIWIPKSRRSHGKVGRWTRAYHLKVPPPPMPPQPPRGGPRQRILPTPRGVNMIVWSLDNRFVLAAIMDCRICVWNAVDGSLVHCLTGHTESTYVLDVHPFNPRIAMSAGYDGKMIVWDIWEGTPIRIYEIGRFKLVDGKFSSDGTSIILSDDVGQLYILNTGQGESQNDAKYDQFFLGDYRPLIQDTHGNVLDQETQLAPYRRNMQDLLCDSGMIPYPEPYQSMYQKRRLGALGIEWRPSPVRFAVGADISLDQDYQMPPIVDLDILIDPLPAFLDAMDWEPEIEVQSDDTDSEYNVTEEYSSAGEQGSLSSNSSHDSECSSEDSDVDNTHKDVLRRSKRKKQKAEVEVMTSSGRRIKRKNLDECDGNSLGNIRMRKSRNGRKASRKVSLSKSLRPQRAAARNALSLFSRITGTPTDGEDENVSEDKSSESESGMQVSNVQSEESDISLQHEHCNGSKGKDVAFNVSEDRIKSHECSEPHTSNGNRRRLVLKLPNRDSSKLLPPLRSQCDFSSSMAPWGADEVYRKNCSNLGPTSGDSHGVRIVEQPSKVECRLDLLEGYKDGKIRWGGVKTRTSKRTRLAETSSLGGHAGSSSCLDGHTRIQNVVNVQLMSQECGKVSPAPKRQEEVGKMDEIANKNQHHFGVCVPEDLDAPSTKEHLGYNECKDHGESPKELHKVLDDRASYSVPFCNGSDTLPEIKENPIPVPTKFRIRSNILSTDHDSRTKMRFKTPVENSSNTVSGSLFNRQSDTEQNSNPDVPKFDGTKQPNSDDGGHNGVIGLNAQTDGTSSSVCPESRQMHSNDRMYKVVYKRSKPLKGRSNPEDSIGRVEASTSKAGTHTPDEGTKSTAEEVHRMLSMRSRLTGLGLDAVMSDAKLREVQGGSDDASTSAERTSINRYDEQTFEDWVSTSRGAVGLRSSRNRRGTHHVRETSPPERRRSNQSTRRSWLLLPMHQEGSRYIPQLGDEVVYLRQGHQEYISCSGSRESGPWRTFKGNIKAAEFCRVDNLEYSTRSGSGESCCRIVLKFVDTNSPVAGQSFTLMLPEETSLPDFLVERTRYDAAIQRNWRYRDKCVVWWNNEGEQEGSWYPGRITGVEAKSREFLDSPWERYYVKYKDDSTGPHRHSPWELHDADVEWKQPCIDAKIREKLLRAFSKLEQSLRKSEDYYGIQKLMQVSKKSSFVNRFPVPLTLDLIQKRIKNNYYRSLEAMKHDVAVMLSNAESYFGRNVENSTKMRHLSDWFTRTLSSL